MNIGISAGCRSGSFFSPRPNQAWHFLASSVLPRLLIVPPARQGLLTLQWVISGGQQRAAISAMPPDLQNSVGLRGFEPLTPSMRGFHCRLVRLNVAGYLVIHEIERSSGLYLPSAAPPPVKVLAAG